MAGKTILSLSHYYHHNIGNVAALSVLGAAVFVNQCFSVHLTGPELIDARNISTRYAKNIESHN